MMRTTPELVPPLHGRMLQLSADSTRRVFRGARLKLMTTQPRPLPRPLGYRGHSLRLEDIFMTSNSKILSYSQNFNAYTLSRIDSVITSNFKAVNVY
ncbi:hypothetical protein TNCV_2562541 [Trichonephila clavipes]|uniref:Uncharacterized protein n=1 Tax=Trichonephila clavipes TaxID=2585209 RepID=A0A8X6R2J7_TRICX|nr:hypothetical protein TNCV_2562541 [Trichonephila clavipes]